MISKYQIQENITSTSVKIQKDLHQMMLERIVKEGYGMRGKSKWIVEAIQSFLSLENFVEFVDIADEGISLDENISLRIPNSVYKKLENALIDVRAMYPSMEGVKSKLVRASITQRLVRGYPVTG